MKNATFLVQYFIVLFWLANRANAQDCSSLNPSGVLYVESFNPPPACGTSTTTFDVVVHFSRQPLVGYYDRSFVVTPPAGWVNTHTSLGTNDRILNNLVETTKYLFRFTVPVTSPNGVIGFVEKATCGPSVKYSTTYNLAVNRAPVAPTVTGNGLFCINNSKTFTVNAPNANGSITWSTGSNLSVASGQGTTSAQIQATGNGSSYVKATLNADLCGNTNIQSASVPTWVGVPVITSSQYWLFDANSNMWQCTSVSNAATSWSWSLVSGSASLVPNLMDCYVTTTSGATVQLTANNTCGSSAPVYYNLPAAAGFRMAYPNPAKDVITLEFNSVESTESLPSTIDLYSESSTKRVKTVSVQEVAKNKTFKGGNKVDLNVGDLPRGIYYLHVNPNEKQKQVVQKVRIRLD